jgi:hypothetical protein
MQSSQLDAILPMMSTNGEYELLSEVQDEAEAGSGINKTV